MSHPIAMCPSGELSALRPSSACRSTTVLATERARPKTRAAPPPHPQNIASKAPRTVATAICTSAPGSATLPHLEKVTERKVQAHSEHQQDDAHVRELGGKICVSDESGCERSERNAGWQISHERRHAQAGGDESKSQRQHECRSDRSEQWGVVRQ